MSLIDCPRCLGRYVDPSPVAALNPRPCPYCTGNTSAAPAQPLDLEDYQRALDEARALGPPPPRVEFFKVPGSTDVAVLVDDTPTGILTAAQFEELLRRLKESDGR